MSIRHRARKRFGQHFLTSSETIGDIVTAIAPQPGDVIVEIGPGQAAITEPLQQYDISLHAVEFDRDLAADLRTRYAGNDKVRIHEADALQFDFASVGRNLRIVGNLPYNISTPLLFRLIEFRDRILDFHFMLQKEVVDRMAAMPGSKDYGRLTIMLGSFLEVVPLFDVPPEAFSPPPKVTSSVVRMRPLSADHWDIGDTDQLSRLVAAAFGKRRKTLRNALKGVVDEKTLQTVDIDPAVRPEQVPVAAWIRLAKHLCT
jgi:16S rRNA (adenine1518-N6/adenine1519-N6)-dimethyltransferase